jgi:hypothetical protein
MLILCELKKQTAFRKLTDKAVEVVTITNKRNNIG